FDLATALADRRRLRARHALVRRQSDRGRSHPAGGLHQVLGRCRKARTMTDATITATNYLTADNRLRSWFLTTDHKRVAILYFASITMFFAVGGTAATLIRLELATPAADLVTSDVYNRLFTMHGIVMVWFFLIPSIPTTMGNF